MPFMVISLKVGEIQAGAMLLENESDLPLVFIHGYKGSHLADDKGKLHWLTFRQAVDPFYNGLLQLPMTYTDGRQDFDTLRATGIFLTFGGLAQFYGPIVNMCERLGRPFYPFFYDWRRDNNETSAQFQKFLENIVAERGRAPQIIAHSMGGYITLSVLNRKPELAHSVLTAGMSFDLSAGGVREFNLGNITGFNMNLTTPKANFTFPSLMSFFPLNNHDIYDVDGNQVVFDYYDPDNWVKYKLGPWNQTAKKQAKITPEHMNHLRIALAQAKKFRMSSDIIPGHPYPPLAYLAGSGYPVMNQVMKDGPKSIRGYDYTSRPQEDGDSILSVDRAHPAEGSVPHRFYITKRYHTTLLNDLPLVFEAIGKLIEDRAARDGVPAPIRVPAPATTKEESDRSIEELDAASKPGIPSTQSAFEISDFGINNTLSRLSRAPSRLFNTLTMNSLRSRPRLPTELGPEPAKVSTPDLVDSFKPSIERGRSWTLSFARIRQPRVTITETFSSPQLSIARDSMATSSSSSSSVEFPHHSFAEEVIDDDN